MSDHVLSVSQLAHAYNGKTIFSGFDFDLTATDSILLQGENGAGKTTLLKIVAGLLAPSHGEFELNSRPAVNYATIKHRLRQRSIYLHQQPLLFDTSVRVNLEFATHSAQQLPRSEQEAIIERLQIASLLTHHAPTLSIGQKQRVAIARSLIYNPELLILDEPFSALDRASFDIVMAALWVYKSAGGTLLMVSHQHDCRFELIDTCWCIHPQGKLFCVSAD